jgi:hypothetical protein
VGYTLYTERKRLREKGKCPKLEFIMICLKESFHREKKDEEKSFFVFMQTDLPLG